MASPSCEAASRRGMSNKRLSGARRWGATVGVLLLGLVQVTQAAVIGIDLGSEYMKVSLVKPGSMMDIVTNVHSKRKTENMVSFYEGERSYGADAYSLLTRRPEKTYARLSTLLGRHDTHPSVELLDKSYFPTKVSYNESKGGLSVAHEEGVAFSPEELVAMVLGHASDITKGYGGVVVRDAVLIAPSFFTQPERQALLDAAEIAGLNVLSLMDENTAAGLLFAIDNVYTTPTYIVFYNLGASSLQVSVVQYSSYTMGSGSNEKRIGVLEVKAKAWDEHLGGFRFDLRLAELLADRFNAKWAKGARAGKDVRAFPRAMAKLRAQAKKVKEVLSANSNIPVHVESVHDDIDLSTTLSRADFEEAASDLFSRATAPLDAALAKANITLSDVTAVEVLGGGIRVPKLQQTLRDHFNQLGAPKLELSMHLNGDEAMAQGAAFFAANISTQFKVRVVGVTDILPFAVGVRMEEAPSTTGSNNKEGGGGLLGGLFGGGKKNNKKEAATEGSSSEEEGGVESKWTKRNTIFSANSRLGQTRKIAFSASKDLLVNLTYDGTLPHGAQNTIALYHITGVEALAKEAAAAATKAGGEASVVPKVTLTFRLDSSGMVRLVKAEAKATLEPPAVTATTTTTTEEEEASSKAEEEQQSEQVKEGEDDEDDEAAAAAPAATTTSEEGATTTANTTSDATNTTSAANATNTTSEAAAVNKTTTATPAAPAAVVLSKSLDFKVSFEGLKLRPSTTAEKEASKLRLAELKRRDAIKAEKAEARNALETYINDLRYKMMDREDEVNAVSSEEQRTAVSELANELDDWVYGDGSDVEASVYREKLAELRKLWSPIVLRMSEGPGGERQRAVEGAEKAIADMKTLVKKWEVILPQVTEEEKKGLLTSVDKVESWLKDKVKEQEAKAAHDEPAFLSADVAPRLKPLKETVKRLARKPKPPPPPPKPKSNKTAGSNETTTGNSTTTTAGDNSTTTPLPEGSIKVEGAGRVIIDGEEVGGGGGAVEVEEDLEEVGEAMEAEAEAKKDEL